MQRRSPVPHLILGIMTLLAAGAVVLGLVLAPTTTDLTVHNGAGQTLLASQVTALYTRTASNAVVRIQYVAPDFGRETLISGGPAKVARRSVTYHGQQAQALLGPVTEVLQIGSFTKVGHQSVYVGTEPAAKLVPVSEASLVSGSLRATVTVTNGYVVKVIEKVNLTTPGGSTKEGIHYNITRVDNWKVPTA
ncbi:MAG TPA: hypothetical protein VHW47_08775 [Acidimicrobiales bacterium]|jgi:hypothetical protein|nr:hypothetical protein [Acidimicrobiales bacterium]